MDISGVIKEKSELKTYGFVNPNKASGKNSLFVKLVEDYNEKVEKYNKRNCKRFKANIRK